MALIVLMVGTGYRRTERLLTTTKTRKKFLAAMLSRIATDAIITQRFYKGTKVVSWITIKWAWLEFTPGGVVSCSQHCLLQPNEEEIL